MKKFKILSRETLIESPYCPVEKQIVEFPNGERGEWFVNTSADAVIVIPVTVAGKIILQKSYKHGGGAEVVEFCAGMIDEGETPIEAAVRELQEETGYRSADVKKIGEVFSNPTGSTMKYHFFLARNCVKNGEQKLDLSEQIEVFLVENWEGAKDVLLNQDTQTSSATMAGVGFMENVKC